MTNIVDGIYEEVIDDSYNIASALVAGAAPMYPPDDWYASPNFTKVTPLTITADGRVMGHIASWKTDHIGLPPGTKPPRSSSDYAFFKTGVVKTESGAEAFAGQLTLAGGHAPLSAGAGDAVKHYDDTASSVADVTVGEDMHGIWVSGGLRPGVTDDQIRALRASAPSGDWRPINGKLELVAVCQVNTPGFPIARSMVASGEIVSLVAAGAAYMYELQREEGVMHSLDDVARRVTELEAVVAAAVPRSKGETIPATGPSVVAEERNGGRKVKARTEDGREVFVILDPDTEWTTKTSSNNPSQASLNDGALDRSELTKGPKDSHTIGKIEGTGVANIKAGSALVLDDDGDYDNTEFTGFGQGNSPVGGKRMDEDGDYDGAASGNEDIGDLHANNIERRAGVTASGAEDEADETEVVDPAKESKKDRLRRRFAKVTD